MSLPTTLTPLVTIVIPVYNGSNYLKEAIESALNQTYVNIEIIVVNDGSDDNGATKEIMDFYGEKIRGFHKKNGGVASALNCAIGQMKGEFLSWLSHDDLYHPEKIEYQIKMINIHGYSNAVMYSDYIVFYNDISSGTKIQLAEISSLKFRYFLTVEGRLNGCTFLIPKKCFSDCGLFSEQLRNVQDYDMWFRIAHDYKFIHASKTLLYSRQHELQCSRVTHDISQEEGNKLLISFVDHLEKEEVFEEGIDSLSYGYAVMHRKLKKRGYKDAARRAAVLSIKNLGQGDLKADLTSMLHIVNQSNLAMRVRSMVRNMMSQLVRLLNFNKRNKSPKKILSFKETSQYWNDRYSQGGDSGSGSYGRLALFKAEILNKFVTKHDIASVVEYGCGDGAQLSLAKYRNYTGFDISPVAIEICRNKFHDYEDYNFLEITEKSSKEGDYDLAISLDVIYHLVEDEIFAAYMERLFLASKKFVIIYSSNTEVDSTAQHEKRRNFITWVEDNASDWELVKDISNKYPYSKDDPTNTSLSDFFIFKKQIGVTN